MPTVLGAESQETFEADRRAILALAGDYKVTFNFKETMALEAGYELREGHESGAMEMVRVLRDEGDHIVLQHILVLPDDDDRVVKHWRQDWTFEPERILRYEGGRKWVVEDLEPETTIGRWAQSVYQVDDSPRYTVLGEWNHHSNYSEWESNAALRPLPRREWSTRDDYNRLLSRHRVTHVPAGWIHEQDNLKLIEGNPSFVYLTRESGLNTYQKVDDFDFTPGIEYWEQTGLFWDDVRAAWLELIEKREGFALKGEVDGKPLWRRMFDTALEVKEVGGYQSGDGTERIQAIIDLYLLP